MKRTTRYMMLACSILSWISMPVFAESPVGGGH